MTQGQVMFYSGAGLLAVTLLLAVFFWIKRPRYEPSSAVYRYTEERDTAKQRGTHSSAGLTQSGDGADDAATRAGLVTNTDLDATVTSDETVALGANEAAASDETVALGANEAAASDETVPMEEL